MAGETELGNANGLGVQYLKWITFYTVSGPLESANLLHDWRFKVVDNENVAKVILRVQVVDADPLDVGDFLVVRQAQGKVLVEVPRKDVGTGIGAKKEFFRISI